MTSILGKTKRRLQAHTSTVADHTKATGHIIKWDHFDILATGKTDCHDKMKRNLVSAKTNPKYKSNKYVNATLRHTRSRAVSIVFK